MGHNSKPRIDIPAELTRINCILTVVRSEQITPNMIRVTLTGPELTQVPLGCDGSHCKLQLPAIGQGREDFETQLNDGPKPPRRTFTVRHVRHNPHEIDIDFVDHGDSGPASAWAHRAAPGAFLHFSGPGKIKVSEFYADWYLVAADMAGLPVASAVLEVMPSDAKGLALLEITDEADRQPVDAPAGVEVRWLIHPDPQQRSTAQEAIIRGLDWPDGTIQTCIAGESGTIRSIRDYLHNERKLPKDDTYISGYWKIGLV
ncbi:MAG: siderophore-interacting protein, partial [Pseudomonadota bacterium]